MLSLNPAAGDALPPRIASGDPNPVEAYVIARAEDRVTCWVWRGHGVRSPLPHLVRHSPTGFGIGYGGSGPADLALSILAHHLDTRDVEPRLYQAFKASFLAHPEHAGGRILTAAQIEAWLGMVRAAGFELEAAS